MIRKKQTCQHWYAQLNPLNNLLKCKFSQNTLFKVASITFQNRGNTRMLRGCLFLFSACKIISLLLMHRPFLFILCRLSFLKSFVQLVLKQKYIRIRTLNELFGVVIEFYIILSLETIFRMIDSYFLNEMFTNNSKFCVIFSKKTR